MRVKRGSLNNMPLIKEAKAILSIILGVGHHHQIKVIKLIHTPQDLRRLFMKTSSSEERRKEAPREPQKRRCGPLLQHTKEEKWAKFLCGPEQWETVKHTLRQKVLSLSTVSFHPPTFFLSQLLSIL